jgi:hypothetical protein
MAIGQFLSQFFICLGERTLEARHVSVRVELPKAIHDTTKHLFL